MIENERVPETERGSGALPKVRLHRLEVRRNVFKVVCDVDFPSGRTAELRQPKLDAVRKVLGEEKFESQFAEALRGVDDAEGGRRRIDELLGRMSEVW